MQKDKLIALYQRNNLAEAKLNDALGFLDQLEQSFSIAKKGIALEALTSDDLDQLIAMIVENNLNDVEHFVVLMRYFKVVGRNDLFIHLTKYTGSLGVFESILEKLSRCVDKTRYEAIKSIVEVPTLGCPLDQMPNYTKKLLDALDLHLTPEEIKNVLTDNHHHIPRQAFLDEKIHYEHAATLDDYLKDLHQRKVAELRSYQADNRVWYEQEINDKVIEFVASSQEVLSAVRVDDTLYVTKIPYDTKAYLEAESPQQKRYHACHCPFVKSIVATEYANISPQWCLCSAGFTKYPFEVLFDRELPIECLQTPLNGDLLCRFAISLAGVNYKK